VGGGALRGEAGQQLRDRVGLAAATLEVAGLSRQIGEQVAEALACDREEPAVAGDAHSAGVASCLWQKIAGCAVDHGAERVSRSASIVASGQATCLAPSVSASLPCFPWARPISWNQSSI